MTKAERYCEIIGHKFVRRKSTTLTGFYGYTSGAGVCRRCHTPLWEISEDQVND